MPLRTQASMFANMARQKYRIASGDSVVAQQIAFAFCRRPRAREMLLPGEVIDAHAVRNRRVRFPSALT